MATLTPRGKTREEAGKSDHAQSVLLKRQALKEYTEGYDASTVWERNAFNLGFDSGWQAKKRFDAEQPKQ